MIGVTPMIGQNDISSEVFTLADAQTLANFGKQKASACCRCGQCSATRQAPAGWTSTASAIAATTSTTRRWPPPGQHADAYPHSDADADTHSDLQRRSLERHCRLHRRPARQPQRRVVRGQMVDAGRNPAQSGQWGVWKAIGSCSTTDTNA